MHHLCFQLRNYNIDNIDGAFDCFKITLFQRLCTLQHLVLWPCYKKAYQEKGLLQKVLLQKVLQHKGLLQKVPFINKRPTPPQFYSHLLSPLAQWPTCNLHLYLIKRPPSPCLLAPPPSLPHKYSISFN